MADYHLFPILSKFDRLVWRSDDPNLGECRCPAHEDSTNSLHVTIKIGDNGQPKILLKCHAGCNNLDICKAVGETLSSLFPDRTRGNGHHSSSAGKVKPKFVCAYNYPDSSGVVQHQTVRWEPKNFTQRRRVHSASPVIVSGIEYIPFRDPHGNYWINTLKGIEPLIYDLPRILKAPIDRVIFICEGEKDVETLKSKFGVYATTVPMGSGKWRKSYRDYFRGRRVIIIPDTDKPRIGQSDPTANAGYDGARKIASELVEISHEVRICYLPNLFNFVPKWDLTNWLKAGGTKAQFIEACGKAPVLSVGHPGLIPAGIIPHSSAGKEEDPSDSLFLNSQTPNEAILLPAVINHHNSHATNGKTLKLNRFGQPIRGQLTNVVETSDGFKAIDMQEITDGFKQICNKWPKRVQGSLFYVNDDPSASDDPEALIDRDFYPIQWMESTASLFAWAGRYSGMPIYFPPGGGASKEEVFADLRATSEKFESVEQYPHEPRVPTVYYACKPQSQWVSQKPGCLYELIAKFEPASAVDFDLIIAMLGTLVWGGGGGRRPIFIITSESGRGAGKTTFATLASSLVGGCLQLSAHADDEIIRQRLLSPEGMERRCVLLDNAKSLKFSWAEFEAISTSEMISGKKMYVGEASRANRITYMITMNGPSLSTDLAQRSVTIKLGPPKHEGSWLTDITNFINQHKVSLLAELMDFLRQPKVKLEKYTRWGDWEENVLCCLLSAAECQAEITARQKSLDVEQDESNLIEEYFEKQLFKNQCRPESDKTFISSSTAADWLNAALGERHSKSAGSKMLHQKINERRLPRLEKANGPQRIDGTTRKEQGFWWTPEGWTEETGNVIRPGSLGMFGVDDFVTY